MRLASLLLSTLVAFTTTAPAVAQSERAAAVALFDEARDAVQRGDFDIACVKFEESNRLDPAIGTAFNLANCEEHRGRLATAWVLFREVAGRMKNDDPRLEVANARIAALEPRIPRVRLVANAHTPRETRVRIDNVEFSTKTFGSAVPLDPGPHRTIIRAPGAEARTTAFTLAEGETFTLSLAPPEQPTRKSDEGAPEDRILGVPRSDALLVTGGLGVVGLGVGLVAGIIGLNAESTGDDGCSPATKTCSQEGYDANQRAKTMAIVSTVGLAAGTLGGGATAYVYLSAPAPGAPQHAASAGLRGTW